MGMGEHEWMEMRKGGGGGGGEGVEMVEREDGGVEGVG